MSNEVFLFNKEYMTLDELTQDFKELDKYIDDLYRHGVEQVKDAGHLWIAFTDKFNAFKRKIIAVPTKAPVTAEEGEQEELDRRDEAAIYLEQNHIGGDTMVMMNFCLDELPQEQIGSFNLFDLLSEFANKAIRNERPFTAHSREEDGAGFEKWAAEKGYPLAIKNIADQRAEIEELKANNLRLQNALADAKKLVELSFTSGFCAGASGFNLNPTWEEFCNENNLAP